MVSRSILRAGDRVEIGNKETNDYDHGRVVEVLNTGEVSVRWRIGRLTCIEDPETLTMLAGGES